MSEIVIYPNNSGRVDEKFVTKSAIRMLISFLKIPIFRLNSHPNFADKRQLGNDILLIFSTDAGGSLNAKKMLKVRRIKRDHKEY